MKHIYMNLDITFYGRTKRHSCFLWERIDDGELTCRELTLVEAQQIQWELVKAGADRIFRSNMFNNAISEVSVDYWMRH